MTGRVTEADIEVFTEALAECLRPTFQAFSDLSEPAVAVVNAATAGKPFEAVLALFDTACRAGLDLEPELLHGTGFMAETNAIAGSGYWARWWWRTPEGALQLGEHTFDPTSEAFYDYTDAEWFVALRDGADDTVFGPYVDFNGTNDYTLTLGRAVRSAGAFLGSVGGDITVAALERKVEPLLRELGTPALLTNEENRVIISTDAQWSVGSRLMLDPSRPHRLFPAAPWTLVIFDEVA